MYLLECVTAYMGVKAMMEQECSYKTAHALLMLKKMLQPHAEFFANEEMKLASQFAVKDEAGAPLITEKGVFEFKDGADPAKYNEKRRELGMVSVEIDFEPVRVPVPAVIKPVHLEALEKFIIFEEGTA